ncbi:response regulator transcription factor [Alkaliphilus peptidifermentans]|uniref:Regulatory protein, luxR family n=1 Tax=Alkaliphilus peptidifermentans DSM 18978 TaxID=1120976 RepID=A0A1G5I276_9FIRM|nr:LuxR C-terminal-related transcriptional regulator [Alkaliphilus peptidifermentans]SCY70123.1 regulatory protein, luxR family [Alkaliphilus peptidifermentans DSM 18978]
MVYEQYFYEAMFQSWEKCINIGISKEIEKPLIKLTKNDLAVRQEKNNNLILKFNDFLDKHIDAIKNVNNGGYYFILFDEDGYILDTIKSQGKGKRMSNSFISPGISFDESSIGTNALVFAKKFKSAICMLPSFHYCNKLKDWYEYCVPIKINELEKGYISVVSEKYPVTKAVVGFVDLLQTNMLDEYFNVSDISIDAKQNKHLTERQYVVLKLIAEGLSDESISHELKISLSTVKYHNQSIFKHLNATSRVEAVIKALILKEISIADLYNIIA